MSTKRRFIQLIVMEANNQLLTYLKMISQNTETLMSLYANYSISETLDVFVRNDMTEIDGVVDSDVTTSWIGVVCNPYKGLYISPNVVIEDGTNDYRLTFMFKY